MLRFADCPLPCFQFQNTSFYFGPMDFTMHTSSGRRYASSSAVFAGSPLSRCCIGRCHSHDVEFVAADDVSLRRARAFLARIKTFAKDAANFLGEKSTSKRPQSASAATPRKKPGFTPANTLTKSPASAAAHTPPRYPPLPLSSRGAALVFQASQSAPPSRASPTGKNKL